MTKDKKFAVLGAGPAGLMTAWYLAREGYEVVLLEKENHPGGYGASFRKNGFILDYGPHTLHVKKGETVPIIQSFFKDGLLREKRNIRTLAHGRYLKYPFEFYNLLTQLNPFFVFRIIFDFLMASLIYKFIHVPDDNFESWGIKRFGKRLYEFCFGKYTERVWGIPPRLISPKFAANKIKQLDFKSIVSKILGGKGEEQEIYWEDLLYPEFGSGQLFDRMADDFRNRGGALYLGAPVTGLHYDGSRVTGVDFAYKGMRHSMDVDYIISTISLKSLVLMVHPSFGDYITYTAKRLKDRAMIFVYVVVDADRVSDAHWVYLLDGVFKFNRFTEQKNISRKCCPDGKTILCFEMCCQRTDPVWDYTEDQLRELVMDDIRHIRVIPADLISDCFVAKKEEAYVVCYLNYEQQVKDLLEHISQIPNLLSTGRQGLYLQNDMHDAMSLGLDAAKFFLQGREDNFHWYKEKTEFLDWDR